MMALDRGGTCKGAIYRLPSLSIRDHIRLLVAREITVVEDLKMVRWVNVETSEGTV
jgi:cation transport protein ChaC